MPNIDVPFGNETAPRFHLSEVSPLWRSLETRCPQKQLSASHGWLVPRSEQERLGFKASRGRRKPMFLRSNLL